MKYKLGVDAEDIRHQIWFAIGFAEALSEALGYGEVVVTSLRDGTHSAKSLHYEGLAMDLRTRNLTAEQICGWVSLLKKYLDPRGFDVVLEEDHIHVEFQPKPGEHFDERVI